MGSSSSGIDQPIELDFEVGTASSAHGIIYAHIREILDPLSQESPVPANRAAPAPDRPRNPGGAQLRFDWERMWIEIAAIAKTPDGLPDRPTLTKLLYDKMIEWDWEPLPSESAVKAKLRHLFSSLHLPE